MSDCSVSPTTLTFLPLALIRSRGPSLPLYPSISPCLSLTYALCLVFPVSLALAHSCSVSHLYNELSAHSSGHSDESCLSEGTQPSAGINAAPAHQECVKCRPPSHLGSPVQNAVTPIYCDFVLRGFVLMVQSFIAGLHAGISAATTATLTNINTSDMTACTISTTLTSVITASTLITATSAASVTSASVT